MKDIVIKWLFHIFSKWFILYILCGIFIGCLQANPNSTEEKLKVLIVTGGHQFERTEFFQMFDSFDDIVYTEVQHPWANYSYNKEIADTFDVFVFYDMYQNITAEQKSNFLSLLNQGKAMVFFHHSLASYQDWPEFEKIIGGHYYLNPVKSDGKEIQKSTFKHDVDLNIQVVDKSHPITKGITNFHLLDEVYGNYLVLPSSEELLTTTHPESERVIAWTHQYKNSRIVYIQSGHDHVAYQNIYFRKILLQAIKWAVKETNE